MFIFICIFVDFDLIVIFFFRFDFVGIVDCFCDLELILSILVYVNWFFDVWIGCE